MCGLLAIFSDPRSGAMPHAARAEVLLDRLAHRGPDGRGVNEGPGFWIGHRRLAIVDPSGSSQPFEDSRFHWAVNGEIYNHDRLRSSLGTIDDAGDCAVLGPLWQRDAEAGFAQLQGPFAAVLFDAESGDWVVARDAMGISPLYRGFHADGSLWFASEMKALVDDCADVQIVEPGTLIRGHGATSVTRRWYRPAWIDARASDLHGAADPERLRELLEESVLDRLMSDVPMGVLLSGGLDSSIVASIAARHADRVKGRSDIDGRLSTFSIGMRGSPDIVAARRVAKFIGSDHHEFLFTAEEALAAVPDVVKHLESFEQIRTAVPTYLLAQRVRELGFKAVLSGEGADEIFGGYLYFHRAPDAQAFHDETVRKVLRLHQFDVMRANKAPMAFGLELRFPFLDRRVVDWAMELDPREKMIASSPGRPSIEKHLLRTAFDTPQDPWLPRSILWRQKEQFSDGVGYTWVEALQAEAERRAGGMALAKAAATYGEDAPESFESLWMRELFEKNFVEGRAAGAGALATVPRGRSIACSTPEALAWDEAWSSGPVDMSGRAALGIHRGYEDAFDEMLGRGHVA